MIAPNISKVVLNSSQVNLIIVFHPINRVLDQFNKLYYFCYVMLTWSLFLVALKKSSMRVCLLRPAALSFSLSSRLLSRVWRNFSIRRRTLSSLKTHQREYSHYCLWKRQEKHVNVNANTAMITYLTCLTWQRNPTKASSSGSVQVSSGATVCGASKNIFRASLYFQKCGTGWVWRAAHNRFLLDITLFCKATYRKENKDHCLYLSVDMQNHVLNSTVLLDQCQSSLRTQTSYLVAVVTAQQNTEVNKLVGENCKKKFEDL